MKISSDTRAAGSARWLRSWLAALSLGLLLVALYMSVWLSRRAVFLVLFAPLGMLPFSYARFRLHLDLRRHLGGLSLAVVACIGVLLDALMVAQLLTGRSAETWPLLHGPGINWVGPVWFSAHGLLFLGYALTGATRALGRGALWLWARRPASVARAGVPAVASPARREFLQRASLVGAGVPFFVSLSSVPLSYDLRVEEHEIELPHWPHELDGLRIVHLSDIHVGGGMTRARLLRMRDLTNSCHPDLVAHTGDFLTHRSGDFDAPLYEALAGIRAPLGQWACLGNHDYDDAERFTRRLTETGVRVLRDRLATIDVRGHAVELGGAEFVFARSERRAAYASLLSSWTPRSATPRILLNHDPTAFRELPVDAADLVLSGHTHGGHVGVQLGRDHAITVVSLAGLPDQGVFRRGDMAMFVTRCVGFYGYPMRVGIPPEVALLILRAPRTPRTEV